MNLISLIMWVSYLLHKYNSVLMIQLLFILSENIIDVQASYVCDVAEEKIDNHEWRWVLPHKDPCKCSLMKWGGVNLMTPRRPYKPVYVEKPFADSTGEVRDYNGWNCIELRCPMDKMEMAAHGEATKTVTWESEVAEDNHGKPLGVTCNPPSGTHFSLGRTLVICYTEDQNKMRKNCTFNVNVMDYNECASGSHNCRNDATCTNTNGGYACTCNEGFIGDGVTCDELCPSSFDVKDIIRKPCSACYHGHSCNEVLAGLSRPFGMEDGSIEDTQLVSSIQYYDHFAYKARLNGPDQWCSRHPAWIQVDLLAPVIVTGLQTQGGGMWVTWVTSLSVETGLDVLSLKSITENGTNITKNFTANENQHDVVKISFPEPVITRYIRIHVVAAAKHPCMRFEIIGYDCMCPYGLYDGYCAKEPGWQIVFKAVAGVSSTTQKDGFDIHNPFEVWSRAEPCNENITEAQQLNNNFKGHYKSVLALDWEAQNIQQVKVVLFNATATELMSLTFDAIGTNHLNWFSKDRLLSAPYDDICNERRTVFSASRRENEETRQWFIRKQNGECEQDSGWMTVVYDSNPECEWEMRDADIPRFLYSKGTKYTNWNDNDKVGEANIFAIFVKK